MKKETKVKIKRFLCGIAGHRYRKMHTAYRKKTGCYVYVFKCIRCGKIKTVKERSWLGFKGKVVKFQKFEPLPYARVPFAEGSMPPGVIVTSDEEDGNELHNN